VKGENIMKITKVEGLANIANDIRIEIIEQVYNANSGHPGGSLSCADILAVLYFNQMNIDSENPNAKGRDRFVLSKGHCAPALYATLARKGYFDKELLKGFRKVESNLQGHPDMKKVPGVDMSTGSLGQGLSAAVGMAIGSKMEHEGYRVYCLLGDGELEEGQVWEAAMSASKNKLDNLCAIVDYNTLQIDGNVEEVAGLIDIKEKFESFGFNVIEVNGHDIEALIHAFNSAKHQKDMPSVIIAHTIKGKGVSFMEGKAEWHGKAPNQEQYEEAINELKLQHIIG
jgi:transketolase